MAISAINNPTAFSVYANYSNSSWELNASMSRLATGIKNVADDSAGVGISERMRSQARSTAMARNNVENSVSMLQTADGWMQQVNDLLARMHELSIEAADATKTNTDKANVQAEFSELQKQITMIGDKSARFNGQALFSTGFTSGVTTQVGADAGQTITITISDLRSVASTVIGSTVTWSAINDTNFSAAATTAITKLKFAIDYISKKRAEIGGQMSRLNRTRSGLLTYEDNIRSAESKIRDVDMAHETSNMTKYQILTQVGNAMLAQANQLPSGILQLLQ